MHQNNFIIVGILFFWSGFVCAISFMEAWIKFRAKGVSLPIGLSIGKKVFHALNRMEWIFLLLYFICFIFMYKMVLQMVTVLSMLLLFILIVQTAYLLPKLDQRADLIIEGKNIEKSHLHFYYVALELIKVLLLLILGFIYVSQFQSTLVKL